MRFKLLLAALIVSSCACAKAYAQLEKGDVRVGGSFRLEAFEDETNADFGLDLGYLFSERIEGGALLGVTKKEGIDSFGRAGVDLIYHLMPEKRVVPGLGVALSQTFGYPDIGTVDQNSLLWDIFLNLESFVTSDWTINLKAGWQRWDGDWGDSNGFVARIGFATFFKTGN